MQVTMIAQTPRLTPSLIVRAVPYASESEGMSGPLLEMHACNEDLMGDGPGYDVAMSHGVPDRWNLLEIPPESFPGSPEG